MGGCKEANNHTGSVSSSTAAPWGWRQKSFGSRWAKIDVTPPPRSCSGWAEEHEVQRHRVSTAVNVARSLLLANYLRPCVNKHAAGAQHTMYLQFCCTLHYLLTRLATARLLSFLAEPAIPSTVCWLAQDTETC